MPTASVSLTGVASASAYGVSVNSTGSVNIDGLVSSVMGYLDSKAPNFVKALLNSAANVGATTLALDAAIGTAVYALPAEIGASVALFGPFVPVAAAVMAIPVLLLTLDPASGGTGCCGTRQYTQAEASHQWLFEHGYLDLFTGQQNIPYTPTDADLRTLLMYSGYESTAAPCDPSEYAWQDFAAPPAGSAEAFIDSVVKAAFEASNGCWSTMSGPEYAVTLAAAVGVWNRANASKPTTVVSRKVNTTQTHPAVPGGFSAYTDGGQPEAPDPISVALNFAAQKYDASGKPAGWLVGANATATFTVRGNANSVIVAGVIPKVSSAVAKAMGVALNRISPATLLQGAKPVNLVDSLAVSGISPLSLLSADMSSADHALVAVSAPPPAATSTSLFSKPLIGKVTYGEAGIGALALGVITKLMKVW